jgi:uncharacterized protein (DUF58 family)
VSAPRHDARWRTAIAPAALLVAVALWTGSRTLFVAAVLPLGYLAYGALSTVPDVAEAVSVERSLSTDTPFPGEHVGVTVTVTNESDTAIPDLRIVDDVPGGVEAVSRSPAAVVGLRPGESHELTYALVAQRGAHEFGSVSLRARSLSAAAVSSASLSPSGDSGLFCRVHVEDAPVRDQTMQFVGSISTQTGGSGLEFHSTRHYRRGDPMNRIDWRRLAKTGELTTIDYRVQEAARVMVAVDARDDVAVSGGPEYPSSQELSSYGMDLPGTRGTRSPSVLEPSSGDTFRAHVVAVCSAIAGDDADAAVADSRGTRTPDADDSAQSVSEATQRASPAAADGGTDAATAETARLRASLDKHTQVVFVTPALDDFAVTVTETLEGHGHAVTVVSPDVTGRETLGERLARVERAERIEELRGTGAHVVDWTLEDPLPLALAPAFREVR